MQTSARTLALLAGLAVLVAATGAVAQPRHPPPPPGPPPPPAALAPVPLAPGELVGNRIATARSQLDNLNYDQVIALLVVLHDRTDVPPALGSEAALLETQALVALHHDDDARVACARAVALNNYDPETAHDQSPRVQAVCTVAADQARHDLVATRHVALGDATVTPGLVAYQPVTIRVPIAGDLAGLTTQAEVTVGDAAPLLLALPPGDPATPRVATLDANYARPDARIQVTALVRDTHGVLARSATPGVATVPHAEAGIRIALHSDEGALRIDHGAPRRAHVDDLILLPAGSHALEVQTPRGTGQQQVELARGDVTLVRLQVAIGVTARDVFRWGTTGVGVVALITAGVFQSFADSNASQLVALSNQHDSVTGLPLVQYSNVMNIDQNRQLFQNVSIGLFAGGGAVAVAALALWLAPDPTHAPATREHVAFGVGPQGVSLAGSF